MEYVYAALILHRLGKKIDEETKASHDEIMKISDHLNDFTGEEHFA